MRWRNYCAARKNLKAWGYQHETLRKKNRVACISTNSNRAVPGWGRDGVMPSFSNLNRSGERLMALMEQAKRDVRLSVQKNGANPMTDTIERMARAAHRAELALNDEKNESVIEIDWEMHGWRYIEGQKAALSALEEPSEAMVAAGERGIWAATMPDEPMHGGACRDVARSAFLHMIKAAKGGEG